MPTCKHPEGVNGCKKQQDASSSPIIALGRVWRVCVLLLLGVAKKKKLPKKIKKGSKSSGGGSLPPSKSRGAPLGSRKRALADSQQMYGQSKPQQYEQQVQQQQQQPQQQYGQESWSPRPGGFKKKIYLLEKQKEARG